ncbi:WYL domain-containing protein [Shewanella sp. BF02_Schw]|uniref:WYL domain-containing protein n=1 Tax=Shewanella sp. BF02_Schw TaxID=394908 RepID=UPI001AA12C33|nr:WYL domain-containing protein [Shewanella sp. BF02_Schw]MBO1896920.1 WYL domain-containing protein [Shewanella sp. BF02_Schw]
MAKDLSYKRFLFIELLAWWQGCISNKQLMQQFGISRQQAYNDFKNYCAQHPQNLIKTDQGYQPATCFNSYYISGELPQFLHWYETETILDKSAQSSHVTHLSIPQRIVSVDVIRTLVTAIEQYKRIETQYVSLSHPENDGRIFHPHTFVNTGLRWHVRGYCEKSQGYRDLVLSRFRDQVELLDRSNHSICLDQAWQTIISIVLKPDYRLSSAQQAVLVNDYDLVDGLLVISTRAALVNYVLHEMQINTKMLDGTPEAQQWNLVNRDDIKQWLF